MKTTYIKVETNAERDACLALLHSLGYDWGNTRDSLLQSGKAFNAPLTFHIRSERMWQSHATPGPALLFARSTFESLMKEINKDKPVARLRLNDEHEAVVYPDRVEVGCQTIPADRVLAVADQLRRAR